ncbi:MAG: hypothetical protein ACFCBW_16030 [Candidatus Competibacterales bacterium]
MITTGLSDSAQRGQDYLQARGFARTAQEAIGGFSPVARPGARYRKGIDQTAL